MKADFKTSLKGYIREVYLMVKNLNFWSIVLGFILGYFMSAGDNFFSQVSHNTSLINTGNLEYWKLVILFLIIVALGVVYYYAERNQSEKGERENTELKASINTLVNEIRQERNERNKRK